MSLRLDVEDRKKILAKNSRENKLKKPMAGFSELKHILIFSKQFWFIYRNPDKLEKVAK